MKDILVMKDIIKKFGKQHTDCLYTHLTLPTNREV